MMVATTTKQIGKNGELRRHHPALSNGKRRNNNMESAQRCPTDLAPA